MKLGVYKITNVKNGKFYIGSSKDIEFRWNEHKKHLNGGYHINNKLQNAWNFYGKESFEFSIIEITNEIDLLVREQFYLDMFKPHMKEIGYNINPTSNGGDTLTHNPKGQMLIEEWRKKYSVLHKGKGNPMHGNRNINYSYDNGLKGKKRGAMSDEMKRKISEQKRNFALRKNEFVDDLKSGSFTNNALSEKYGVSLTTIKLHKRKY